MSCDCDIWLPLRGHWISLVHSRLMIDRQPMCPFCMARNEKPLRWPVFDRNWQTHHEHPAQQNPDIMEVQPKFFKYHRPWDFALLSGASPIAAWKIMVQIPPLKRWSVVGFPMVSDGEPPWLTGKLQVGNPRSSSWKQTAMDPLPPWIICPMGWPLYQPVPLRRRLACWPLRGQLATASDEIRNIIPGWWFFATPLEKD